jgi:hypothetical protein
MFPDETERKAILHRIYDWVAAGSPLPLPANIPEVLQFRDNYSAFEYACEYLNNELKVGAKLPALIDRTGSFVPNPSLQMCSLKIASKAGGIDFICPTSDNNIPKLEPGDLALFDIAAIQSDKLDVNDITLQLNMFGFVTAKLKPEFSLTKGWAITWTSK